MDHNRAIAVVNAWGGKNNSGDLLETVEKMRVEITNKSNKITLEDLEAYNVFCDGMRRLFHGDEVADKFNEVQ